MIHFWLLFVLFFAGPVLLTLAEVGAAVSESIQRRRNIRELEKSLDALKAFRREQHPPG